MDSIKTYNAVKDFVRAWRGRGSEKSDAQSFWRALLQALGIAHPEDFIRFEVPVTVDNHPCFIDGWIERTRVLIEHKSRGIDLDKPAKQSDGKLFTPFEQALRYADARAYSQRPRWIVVCNFDEIKIWDMDRFHSPRAENYRPNVIAVERLQFEFSRLNFLIDPEDENVYPAIKISKQAGELIANLYKFFKSRRAALDETALNKFCVRLVFCLYAEDSGIFDPHQFIDYFKAAADRRQALIDLFAVLDTPEPQRNPNLRAELAQFPYVNGDLFANAAVETAAVRDIIEHYIIDVGDDNRFNWRDINPTIFGALFEYVVEINRSTVRREGGMHYTSPANIHKVIDPLFLDRLHDEFKAIKARRKNKRRALQDFQLKLAALKFLDPACGSGNFLTETFIAVRTLENEVIRALHGLGEPCHVLVTIKNFYGIEINDFAVAIARTAMWIAEHQMRQETEIILHRDIKSLPLTSAAHIVEGNALTLDWREVAPDGVDYIIGNPPFSGARLMSAANKADLLRVFDGLKDAGNLDFVACWFKKAADLMSRDSYPIRAALVATNSITQGETVGVLWRKLFETVHIDFAHRTFKWTHEQDDIDKTAAVHCVIVGFSAAPNDELRVIFDGNETIETDNINGYLLPAPNFFVTSRSTPLSAVPTMSYGNMPIDGGKYLFKADEKEEFIRREPRAEKYFRRWYGAEEFINGSERWCLWLGEAAEDDLRLPLIAERIEAVRRYRLASKRAATRKLADTPTRFHFENMPKGNFIVVPEVSSERRQYIPIGFMTPDNLCSNLLRLVADAELFHFGVLTSSVHMAWTRMVCGRLESRYRYSTQIVYNNFPWCERSARIEQTAQAILDARALYPTWTLAALYDQQKMPPELRAAHEANDLAVLDAYGFEAGLSELEIVVRLMKMYQRLTAGASTDKI